MPITLRFTRCEHKMDNNVFTYFKQLKFIKINVIYVFCSCFVTAKRKGYAQRVKILHFYQQVNILIGAVVRKHKCHHGYYFF